MAINAAAAFRKARPRIVARWLYDRLRHAVATGALEARRWHMRAYDRVHRRPPLPPGSLSPRCLHAAVTDDRYYMRQFREHGPVFKLFWGSGRVKICVAGFARARQLLVQQRAALRLENVQSIKRVVPAEFLRSMNPRIHPHYRHVFLVAFHADLVAPSEVPLRELIQRSLADVAQSTGDAAAAAPRLYEALNTLATRALLRTMLGVDPATPAAAALEAMYRRLGPRGHVERAGARHAVAFNAIRDMVIELRRSLVRDPSSMTGDAVLRRLQEASPSAIDDTVIGNLIYMVERGRHDLRDLLRWIVKYLCDHPATVATLRADLARPGGTSPLAEACVLETLRLDQSEHLNRRVLRSFEFEGFHFPRKAWVSIMTRESHRNPDAFPDPDAFRPERFLARRPGDDEYAPFGIGEHHCIAAALTVRLCTVFIEELVRGYTWTVIADGPRCFGLHWEPSPQFAIELVPVAADGAQGDDGPGAADRNAAH